MIKFFYRRAAVTFSLMFFLSLFGNDDFPYEVPKNFSMFIEKGMVFHPVSTTEEEAQRYFNQGLTLIYAFNNDAAYWSFKRASEIDPNLAMAYWGMALSLGSDLNTQSSPEQQKNAYFLSQKALSLSSNITQNEAVYILALSKRYSGEKNPNQKKMEQNYYEAMKRVVEQYPDDLDAATLLVSSAMSLLPGALWNKDGEPEKGTEEIVKNLEKTLKRDPNHIGANHFYIHAIEGSRSPEKALMSAERLKEISPSLGHLLHMPSHIYILTGDYHLSALSNEAAVKADKEYIAKYGLYGFYPFQYLPHELFFLCRSYLLEGRFEDAKRTANELYDFYLSHFKQMPDMEYLIPTPMFVLFYFHRWHEILVYPTPSSEMKMTNTFWHFTRAMAYASLSNLSDAKKEYDFFTQGASHLPETAQFFSTPCAPILEIADLLLKAKLVELEGKNSLSLDYLQKAINVHDQLSYNQPPDWMFPVRQIFGKALLKNENFNEAEKIFREDLERTPRNGRSLFGLLQCLKGQKRVADAFWVQQEFNRAWQFSTTSLGSE